MAHWVRAKRTTRKGGLIDRLVFQMYDEVVEK